MNVHRCPALDECYHPKPFDQELIKLVAQGLPSRRMALHLNRSANTIKNRLSQLYTVLSVENRASLVQRAYELGLLKVSA